MNTFIHNTKVAFIGMLVSAVVAAPLPTFAQTTNYKPQSVQEMIAYLYGIIAQLEAQLGAQRTGSGSTSYPVTSGGNTTRTNDIEVESGSANNIEDDEATLNGRIDLNGAKSAYVWFEYGEDSDLDERTSRRSISDSSGDIRTFSVVVTNLDEDEKYYFRAVAEEANGNRVYGAVRSFTTDDSRRNNNNDDDEDDDKNNSANANDYDLDFEDTTVDIGDGIIVEWEGPSGIGNYGNVIVLYRTDGDVDWQAGRWFLGGESKGEVTFVVNQAGTYEARLYIKVGNDTDELISSEIEVR